MAGANRLYPYGETSTNILSDAEYQTDTERSTGALPDSVARSKMYNKALKQSAAASHALGQLIANAGYIAEDSAPAVLAQNLSRAINYQARQYAAAAVAVSGTVVTVDMPAEYDPANLPGFFTILANVPASIPAGGTLTLKKEGAADKVIPIWSSGEALADTLPAGVYSFKVDSIGGKAYADGGNDTALRQEVKDLQAGKFNATATRSGSVVSITGPEGAQIITFLTPSAFASGDTYKYNGKAITLTDLNNEALEDAWAAGAPITLSISGSKAFFKAGGGVISDLPPLLPNMQVTVIKGSPKDTYAVKFDKLPDNAETDMLEKFFLTYSYSGTPPEKPNASNILSEKSKSEVLSSAVPPGELSYTYTVPNDKTIIFRQFTQNTKKQLQTELKGAVWPPIVDPWQLPKFTGNHAVFGDEESGRIELYESGTLTLSPGVYDFFAVGGGGAGGTGLRNNRASGGGGGGGYTATVLKKAIAEKSVFAVVVGAGLLGTANDSAPEKQASSSTIHGIITAKGGWRPNSSTSGESNRSQGGDGGSGGGGGVSAYAEKYTAGDGGSDGSDGQKGTNSGTGYPAGKGQGSTTRAFGNMALYAGGGGGGRSGYSSSSNTYSATAGAGGAGGGGGGDDTKGSPLPGTPNTGGGGGGMRGYQATGNSGASAGAGAAGGSGIVIVRWGYTN